MNDEKVRDFLPYADYVPYIFWPIAVWPVVVLCAIAVIFLPPKFMRKP